MKRILIKTLMSLAIGLIVGQIVGMTIKKKTYKRGELILSEKVYNSSGGMVFESFNKSYGLFSGSITGSIVLLVLLYPELKRKDK